MDTAVSFVLAWGLLIISILTLVLHLRLRVLRMEVSRSIPDMLNAAFKFSLEDEKEARDKLLRRVAAQWDLDVGDSVGSCQSLPQELVPAFVNLFGLNSSLCTGWRKVIHDRHFGASRPSEK